MGGKLCCVKGETPREEYYTQSPPDVSSQYQPRPVITRQLTPQNRTLDRTSAGTLRVNNASSRSSAYSDTSGSTNIAKAARSSSASSSSLRQKSVRSQRASDHQTDNLEHILASHRRSSGISAGSDVSSRPTSRAYVNQSTNQQRQRNQSYVNVNQQQIYGSGNQSANQQHRVQQYVNQSANQKGGHRGIHAPKAKSARNTVQVFHYTNLSGKFGIEESGVIWKAQRHAVFGEGVYFTKMQVGEENDLGQLITKDMVAKNNYRNGGPAMKKRGFVDWVFEVSIPTNQIRKCPDRYGRDCWIYKQQELKLEDFDYKVYKVDDPGYY